MDTDRDKAAHERRRHDLDALRAWAMLVGIVYHASLSFSAGQLWIGALLNGPRTRLR